MIFYVLGKGKTFDDVCSEVAEVYVKCRLKFKEGGKATFETYFSKAIRNHAITLWHKKDKERKAMEQYKAEVEEEHKTLIMSDYPVRINGKWVQQLPVDDEYVKEN